MLPKVPVDVPPDLPNVIVKPERIKLDAASRAVSVATMALPEATVPALTARVELASEGTPGVTVTFCVPLLRSLPPMRPVRVVAVPETAPVKFAV